MFFTLTVISEEVVDGQPQKHCKVQMFSDQEKTKPIGESLFIASGAAYDNPEAELTATLSKPAPTPHVRNYQDDRRDAYPSFADQFDLLYHGGIDAWKATIDLVKNKYPKV